jgi:hypothetical protein
MSSTNQTIEITVSPTGETTVQTKGFTGSSCRDASKALERALGIVQSDSPTAEMYQAQTVSQPLRQGND